VTLRSRHVTLGKYHVTDHVIPPYIRDHVTLHDHVTKHVILRDHMTKQTESHEHVTTHDHVIKHALDVPLIR
jgi:hypothetical protein